MTTMMVFIPVDWTAFGRWVGHRGFGRGEVFDEGYALHILLSAIFGKRIVQPFRVIKPARSARATLYAYSDENAQRLLDIAHDVAPPDCLSVLDLDQIATKAMPRRLKRGQRLGFDVRIRPVRRLGDDLLDSQSGRTLHKGSEIDAFRLELLRRSDSGWRDSASIRERHGITRQSVYANWLAERFAGAASIECGHCRLADFRRNKVLRGRGRSTEGPDATLHGSCVVEDPDKFASRLRTGVGRHRAYGYGMILLRPADSSQILSS